MASSSTTTPLRREGLRFRALVMMVAGGAALLGGSRPSAGAAAVEASIELSSTTAAAGAVVTATFVNATDTCSTAASLPAPSYLLLDLSSINKADIAGTVTNGSFTGFVKVPNTLPTGTYAIEFQCTNAAGTSSLVRRADLTVTGAPTTTSTSTTSTCYY